LGHVFIFALGLFIRLARVISCAPPRHLTRRQEIAMKLVRLALLGLVPALVLTAGVQEASAKGCIKGAIVGGIAGHYAGHHGLAGAAAGCVIGRQAAKSKAQKQMQAQPGGAPAQRM
jgi:hypothetical protein